MLVGTRRESCEIGDREQKDDKPDLGLESRIGPFGFTLCVKCLPAHQGAKSHQGAFYDRYNAPRLKVSVSTGTAPIVGESHFFIGRPVTLGRPISAQ